MASCSSSNCHGAQSPRKGSRILQNEYVTWTKHDQHSGAWRVLTEEGAKNMARNLGLQNPERAPECLTCHVGDSAAHSPDSKFTIEDGVGCESCHGAAEQWLSAHTALEASFENNVSLGMRDLRSATARATLCLGCHLGESTREVSHRLYGAGHPRLSFELDTFSALMPTHWQIDQDYSERKGPYQASRFWLVGLAVQARSSAQKIRRYFEAPPSSSGLPEFSLFNCFSCHHALESHEFERSDYDGRPGEPKLNLSSAALLSAALSDVKGERSLELAQLLAEISASAHAELAAKVARLEQALNGALPELEQLEITRGVCGKLARNLGASAERRAKIYYEQAEQIAMGMAALFSGPCGSAKSYDKLLRRLYEPLKSPSGFDERPFREALKETLQAL